MYNVYNNYDRIKFTGTWNKIMIINFKIYKFKKI